MRTRSRVTGADRSELCYRRTNSAGHLQVEDFQDMAYLGMYKEITDEEHPDFKWLQSQGIPVIGPLNVSESETVIHYGSMQYPEGDSRHSYTGDLYTPFSRAIGVQLVGRNSALEACKASAAISALKKLNTAQIDTGEILGTLGSTIAMFRRPLSGMHKLFAKMEKRRAKRYGNLRQRRMVAADEPNRGDWYQATAEVWLEYSFGFRPIFGDISKVISHYENQVELFQNALRVAKGFHVRTVTGSSENTYVHGGENPATGMVAVTRSDVSEKICCAAGVYYKIPMNYSPTARALGLGMHNVANSVWNLTPYSWIVDQVVNVGDWIQAANPDPDLMYLGKYMTVKSTKETKNTVDLKIRRALGSGEPTWYSGSGGGMNQRSVSIERVPTVTLPSSPQWNPNIGFLAQALNDAAFGLLQVRKLLTRFHH